MNKWWNTVRPEFDGMTKDEIEKTATDILDKQNETYDLLVIRSLTDDSLEDEVDYWTDMRNEVLYEDSDIAA